MMLASRCTPAILAVLLSSPLAAAPKPRPKTPTKPAAKPPVAGEIRSLPKGSQVLRGGKPLKGAKAGTPLRPGDVLKARGGNLDLRLAEVASVRLKPGTSLRATTLLKRKPGSDPGETRLRLDAGTVLVRLRKLTGKSRFIIETPSAVTAARGTAYVVSIEKKATLLVVGEGSVGIALRKEPAKELLVAAQEKARVETALPAAAQPVEDPDRPRLRELEGIGAAIDRETEPLVRQMDALMAARKYDEAERAGWYVLGRAWGRRNAVRAHARLTLLWLERDRVFLAKAAPYFLETIYAWAGQQLGEKDPAAPLDPAGLKTVQAFAPGRLADDPIASRFVGIELQMAALWATAPEDRLPAFEAMLPAAKDPVLAITLKFYRASELMSAAARLARTDAARARSLTRQGYDAFVEVVEAPDVPRNIALWAYKFIAQPGGSVPELAWNSPVRLRHARQMVVVAKPARWLHQAYHLSWAYAAAGEPDKAAGVAPAALAECRAPTGALDWYGALAGLIADSYGVQGNAAKEKEWRERGQRVLAGGAP